jgi:hypothetical protein
MVLIRFVESNKVKPRGDSTCPLEERRAAFERLDRNEHALKTVLALQRDTSEFGCCDRASEGQCDRITGPADQSALHMTPTTYPHR